MSASSSSDTADSIATVRVDLGARGYDIVIGPGLFETGGRHIAPLLARPHVVVVSDETVGRLFLEPVEAMLRAAGISCEAVLLPPGEGTKSFEQLENLIDRLLALKVERSDMIIALGGGVVGDIAGFAAGILRRGVGVIQMPTSLLAQVDSSVGGKTGINTPRGKNLVGLFHQPRLVLANVSALETLPRRQFLAGYAEVVKYGLIDDSDFFAWLEHHGIALVSGDTAARAHAVRTSCAAKARIVAADEREAGERALLNLGHTFGHALEAATGFSDRLLHGEAVAIGMVLAFELSARLGLCSPDDGARLRAHLGAVGLPVSPALPGEDITVEGLMGHIAQDKKVAHGAPAYVLARGIGQALVTRKVDEAAVRAVLENALDGKD